MSAMRPLRTDEPTIWDQAKALAWCVFIGAAFIWIVGEVLLHVT